MTIPASAPGESPALSAKTTPVETSGMSNTVNPLIMASSRRESIVTRGGSQPITRNDSGNSITSSSNVEGQDLRFDQSALTSEQDALKQFVNDDRHFSLVRLAHPSLGMLSYKSGDKTLMQCCFYKCHHLP